MNQKSDVLFICNSLYQLMNAINITVNNYEGVRGKADILILELFERSGEIGERLSNIGIFNNVYLAKRLRRGISINKIKLLLHPKNYVGEFSFSDESILKKRYNLIFQGDIEPLELVINDIMGYPDVFLYEDGTGSYTWNNRILNKNWKYRLFCELLHCSECALNIRRLLVYKPELCKSKIVKQYDHILQVNKSNPATSICSEVFGFNPDSSIAKHRFIILDQPIKGVRGYNDKDLFAFVKKIDYNKYHFLLRQHPNRAYEPNELDGVKIDKTNNMWELECINNVSDNHVLISASSTAQTSPKIISGKEPYLIFTYKLFIKPEYIKKDKWYDTTERIKMLYHDKHKIYEPENIDEIIDILNSLRN